MSLTHDCEGSGRPIVDLSSYTESLVRDYVIEARGNGLDDDEVLDYVISKMFGPSDPAPEDGEEELIAAAVDSLLVQL